MTSLRVMLPIETFCGVLLAVFRIERVRARSLRFQDSPVLGLHEFGRINFVFAKSACVVFLKA